MLFLILFSGSWGWKRSLWSWMWLVVFGDLYVWGFNSSISL